MRVELRLAVEAVQELVRQSLPLDEWSLGVHSWLTVELVAHWARNGIQEALLLGNFRVDNVLVPFEKFSNDVGIHLLECFGSHASVPFVVHSLYTSTSSSED